MKYIKANVQGLPTKKRSVFIVDREGERPAKEGIWAEIYKIKDDEGHKHWTTDYTHEEIPLMIGWAKIEPDEKEKEDISGTMLIKSKISQFKKNKGWRSESARHSLARHGIATMVKTKKGFKSYPLAKKFVKKFKKKYGYAPAVFEYPKTRRKNNYVIVVPKGLQKID